MALVKPKLGDDVLKYDENQTEAINGIVDYVIESGESENGAWEKWKSGKLVIKKGFKMMERNDFLAYMWDLPINLSGFNNMEDANLNSFLYANFTPELNSNMSVANANSNQVASAYIVDYTRVRLRLTAEPNLVSGRHRYIGVVFESRWK